MIRFLLDTSACVDYLRGRTPGIRGRLRTSTIDETGISSVTFAELAYGVANSPTPDRNRRATDELVGALAVLPFDFGAAAAYGRIRADLERAGAPIGPLDTLIAAHAVSLGATLVTRNTREFRRVSSLKLEDWS